MKKLTAAAAVLFAAVGAVQALDFDRGADLSAFVKQAGDLRVNTEVSYYGKTCETIMLAASESFAAKDLVSVRYTDRTELIPAEDQGNSAVRIVPYKTGSFVSRVSITRSASRVYPWEKESFSVCALGSELNFSVVSGANQYRLVSAVTPLEDSAQSAAYELAAVKKLPIGPDPEGIKMTEFKAGQAGVYTFSAFDKWASYYAGEKVRFTARVFETVTSYPDAQAWDQAPAVYRRQVAELQLELPAASDYRLTFPLGQVPAGSNYGVSIGFSRIGVISTPEEVEAAVFPL
ncbi:MAG: hypothetical protein NTY45_10675 [Elusimicrobia bacterium]|nr:hypothetical protein [Elusimicrobiota bacterium]